MIGRDKLAEMSMEDIDREMNERATTLNTIGESLLPQILAEEVAELRSRRAELEDQMVTRMASETGVSHSDCRRKLMQHNWKYEEAKV